MDAQLTTIAQRCLDGAHDGMLSFPAIVKLLSDAGFEGYTVDFRRDTCTYYLPDGDSVELAANFGAQPISAVFMAEGVASAVREAQANAPDYTYKGFCNKVRAAGCAGYVVSFLGRRVVYLGRTAETHVELFPQ